MHQMHHHDLNDCQLTRIKCLMSRWALTFVTHCYKLWRRAFERFKIRPVEGSMVDVLVLAYWKQKKYNIFEINMFLANQIRLRVNMDMAIRDCNQSRAIINGITPWMPIKLLYDFTIFVTASSAHGVYNWALHGVQMSNHKRISRFWSRSRMLYEAIRSS